MESQARMIKSSDGNKLAIVNPNAAGIDIADAEMQVCVPEDRDGDNNRRFGSFTKDLNTIVEWLIGCNITTVAMEATGIYYLSLFLNCKMQASKCFWLILRMSKTCPGRRRMQLMQSGSWFFTDMVC